jgi:hypothetical protein
MVVITEIMLKIPIVIPKRDKKVLNLLLINEEKENFILSIINLKKITVKYFFKDIKIILIKDLL